LRKDAILDRPVAEERGKRKKNVEWLLEQKCRERVELAGLGRRLEDDAMKFSASDWNHSRQAAIGSWINRRVSASGF